MLFLPSQNTAVCSVQSNQGKNVKQVSGSYVSFANSDGFATGEIRCSPVNWGKPHLPLCRYHCQPLRASVRIKNQKKKHKQTQGSQDEINDKANVCPSPSVQPITRACGHREATASAKPTLAQEPRGQLTGLQGSDCAVELLGDSVSMWWVHAADMDLTSPKQSRVLKQILRQLIRK